MTTVPKRIGRDVLIVIALTVIIIVIFALVIYPVQFTIADLSTNPPCPDTVPIPY